MLGVSAGEKRLEGRIGGHFDQSSAVQAVIDYYGPSDFVLRGKTQPDRAYTTKSGSYALLGGLRRGEIDEQMERLASPAFFRFAERSSAAGFSRRPRHNRVAGSK